MQSLANERYPLETGGVLIGYVGDNSRDEVVVTAVTGPGPKASHAAHSFKPDHEYQVEEIARHYRRSNRLFTYLGDWHTHPDSVAALSRRDKKTLKHIASHREARLERPTMAILGEGPSWMLMAWRLAPGCLVSLRRSRFVGMQIRHTPA